MAFPELITGTDCSGMDIGKATPFLNIRDSLIGAYMFGTDYTPNPLKDLSYNGNDLTNTGVTFGATSFIASATAYLQTPFDEDDFLAVHGEGTYVLLAKLNSAKMAYAMGAGSLNPATNIQLNNNRAMTAINRSGAGVLASAATVGVGSVAVTNGGTGYANSFTVTGTGGSGQGFIGLATAVAGVIQSIAVVHPGWGYSTAPTLVLTAGGGSSGAGTATLGADTTRTTAYSMFAGAFGSTTSAAYRGKGKSADWAAQVATASRAGTGFGNTGKVRIGYGSGSDADATPEVCGALIFNRLLSNVELDSLRDNIVDVYAGYGVTI